jgi:hypothetical protein
MTQNYETFCIRKKAKELVGSLALRAGKLIQVAVYFAGEFFTALLFPRSIVR